MELLGLRNKKIGEVGRGCSMYEMLNDQYGRRAQLGEGEDAAGGGGGTIWSIHRLFVAQNQETHRMSALRTMRWARGGRLETTLSCGTRVPW